jgi:dolichyl-phosphate beta-glucosyltransferase
MTTPGTMSPDLGALAVSAEAGPAGPKVSVSLRPRRRSVSVIIPAYNEERRLPATLQSLHSFLDRPGYDAEIIVVDDGSRDGTRERASALKLPLVRVLGYSRNRGKGFAVRTGVLAATREAVLFSDADHSTPVSEIERLWPWLDEGYDVAIGSRHAAGSQLIVRQPLRRRIMGRAFNLIVSFAGVRGINDTQCGFKLFRKDAARRIFSRLRTCGFAFDVEVLLHARRWGLRVREVGVQWTNSPDSRVHPVRDSARMLVEILKMRGVL